MKLVYRITTLAVLLLPVLVASTWIIDDDAAQQFPLRTPVTPDILRERGQLRFAINHASVNRFSRPSESAEFDYDLLRQFATDLHIALVERDVTTDDDAARLLRMGIVDVAVLPVGFSAPDRLLPARPCPSWMPQGAGASGRPRVFAWSDSPELVGLLNAAAVRLAAAHQDRALYEIYCSAAPPSVTAQGTVPRAGQISRYAGMIAKYADAAGLDWRLVAAIIFEESSFEEKAVSAKGALGLMQLMPWIPAEVGVASISGADANVRAGVLYLQRLAEQFPEARASDRVALVLASYLLGPAHVFDAQELARDHGMNPQSWRSGIEPMLPLLEDGNIRTRAGFAHGKQAVEYVNRILERYETYRRHLDSEPDLRAAASRPRGDA